MREIRRYFSPILIRAAVYALSLVLMTTGFMLLPGDSFCEGKIVEWLQFTLLLLTALCLAAAGVRTETHRNLSFTLAGCFLMACTRECDRFLDHAICEDFWKVIVTGIFIPVALLIYRKAHSIAESALVFIDRHCFGLLLSGFLFLLFSRLFGHNDFWREMIIDSNHKQILRVIEEGIELAAYLVFLAGGIEYMLAAPGLRVANGNGNGNGCAANR